MNWPASRVLRGHILLLLLLPSPIWAASWTGPDQARSGPSPRQTVSVASPRVSPTETSPASATSKSPLVQPITDIFDRVFAETTPYIPQKTDYALELGSMYEDHNLYWTGGSIGFNTGACWGLQAPNCQQYLSISGGIAGREGYSHAISFGAIRWQYVQLPKTYSPFISVFAGVMNSIVPGEVIQHGLAGASAGLFLYLHESVDLKLEARLGEGRLPYLQLLAGAQFKLDRWLEYFVIKMRDLGIDTAKSTKDAVVSTVTRPGDAMGTVLDVSAGAIRKTGEGIGEATETIERAVEVTGEALTSEEGEDSREQHKNVEDKEKSTELEGQGPQKTKKPE